MSNHVSLYKTLIHSHTHTLDSSKKAKILTKQEISTQLGNFKPLMVITNEINRLESLSDGECDTQSISASLLINNLSVFNGIGCGNETNRAGVLQQCSCMCICIHVHIADT